MSRQPTGLAEIIYTGWLQHIKTWADLQALLHELSPAGLNLAPRRGGYQIDITDCRDDRIFYNYSDGLTKGSCSIPLLFRYFVVRQEP